jgi:prepilin-type N-terminal cleavage/methylation domain-containing protein
MTTNVRYIGRRAFTLVELLVVIAIIAVLAGLIIPGVMAVLVRGPEAHTIKEIHQLDAAMQTFKGDYNLYPLEKLKLCKDLSEYGSTTLDRQSILFLTTMFPKLADNFVGVQWAGPGVTLPAGGVILEGDQVLVFCLGGPPAGTATPNLLGGFSEDSSDPIDVGNTKGKRKKHFAFNTGRLKLVPRPGNTAASYFPSYVDPFEKGPYVYFGTYAGGRYSGVANSLGVSAYLTQASPAKYQNPTRFQIIAPGRDGLFGPGNVVWPSAVVPPGADDMSTSVMDKNLAIHEVS